MRTQSPRKRYACAESTSPRPFDSWSLAVVCAHQQLNLLCLTSQLLSFADKRQKVTRHRLHESEDGYANGNANAH